MSYEDKGEHDDWHMALDLQQQEGGSNGIGSTPLPVRVNDAAKQNGDHKKDPSHGQTDDGGPPSYAPPAGPAPSTRQAAAAYHHTNIVTKAAEVRARDEQVMQNRLQNLQFQYRIYNSDIEPEHEVDYPCSCAICQYKRMKWSRTSVQNMWSDAVMYPGE